MPSLPPVRINGARSIIDHVIKNDDENSVRSQPGCVLIVFVANQSASVTVQSSDSVRGQSMHLWFMAIRNGQRCCSAAEHLHEALQNRCKVATCNTPKFWLLNAATSSHLTPLSSDFTAAQTFYEITTSAA